MIDKKLIIDVIHLFSFLLDTRPAPPLGSLSAQYESGGRGAATINAYKKSASGDHGGASYGTYQIATNTGMMNNFLTWLNKNHPNTAAELVKLTPATNQFDAEWKKVAREKVTD